MTVIQVLELLNDNFKDLNLELNQNLQFGTLTSKISFKLAKELKQNPLEIAKSKVIEINNFIHNNNLQLIIEPFPVGAYINIKFLPQYYKDFLETDFDNPFIYIASKKSKTSSPKTVIEYISPNLTKPLHIGHLLQGVYASSLEKFLKLANTNIISNCFVGDWGINLGVTIWGWKHIKSSFSTVKINDIEEIVNLNFFETNPIDTLVKTYVWANQQKEIYSNFDEEVRIEHVKLENGDQENLALWSKFREESIKSLELVLNDLNINKFDNYNGEHHSLCFVDRLVKYIKNNPELNDIFKIDNKGIFVQFDEINIEKSWPNINTNILKSIKQLGRAYLLESKSGYTTYLLRDIAAKIQYCFDNKFEKQIMFVGNEQKHHFEQVFAICDLLTNQASFADEFGNFVANNIKYNNLKVILNGLIFTPAGKMSTRKGNFVTAENTIEEIFSHTEKILIEKQNQNITSEKIKNIGLAALKWFLLNKDVGNDATLNIKESLNFTGNTGVYQLYTISRFKSILRKNQDFKLNEIINIDLLNDLELQILQKLTIYELIVNQVINTEKIHPFITYLFELTVLYNSWYEATSIINEADEHRKNTLLQVISKIIKLHENLLLLIGINTVEQL